MKLTKPIIPLLVASILFTCAIRQGLAINKLKAETRQLSASVTALHSEQERTGKELTVKLTNITSELERAEQEPQARGNNFVPLDIPLEPELQEFCAETAEKHGVPNEIALAVIEHESRFVWQEPKADSNGLLSVGYMQINAPHWQRLKDSHGIDVCTPRGNIEGGIIILSEILSDYPLEKALVVYNYGAGGAKGIDSTEYSRAILEISEGYKQEVN